MTSPPTITQQVRELQTMPAASLAEHYTALFGRPPRVRNAAWLRRQVAWRLQANEFGGLSDGARTRLDELVARIDLPLGQPASQPRRAPPPSPPRPDATTPLIGTMLQREYRGQQIRVEVLDSGFAWNGTVYTSLSATAKAITGSAWNGRLFFNLVKRGRQP